MFPLPTELLRSIQICPRFCMKVHRHAVYSPRRRHDLRYALNPNLNPNRKTKVQPSGKEPISTISINIIGTSVKHPRMIGSERIQHRLCRQVYQLPVLRCDRSLRGCGVWSPLPQQSSCCSLGTARGRPFTGVRVGNRKKNRVGAP